MDTNKAYVETNQEKVCLIRNQERLLLRLLIDCLGLNLRNKKIIYSEYRYLLNIHQRTEIPLKQIIEDRIFQLQNTFYEIESGNLNKNKAIKINLNKRLLNT